MAEATHDDIIARIARFEQKTDHRLTSVEKDVENLAKDHGERLKKVEMGVADNHAVAVDIQKEIAKWGGYLQGIAWAFGGTSVVVGIVYTLKLIFA